jgi:glycerophosphoryl diester phosphodiesterase
MIVKLTSNWNLSAPLVIAHRGASLLAPENTLAAFRLAADLGADAIELDAKLTVDGHVVIHHDLTLDRTTTGRGYLKDCTLEELQRVDAGSHFDATFVGERIPSLRDVFLEVGDKLLINVELTNYGTPFDALPEAVVELISEFNLEQRVLLSSFSPLSLMKTRRLAPDIPLGLLINDRQPSWLISFLQWISPHEALHPHLTVVNREMIHQGHARGRNINVWTVNEPVEIQALEELGVDGIITDAPDTAREIIGKPKPIT